MPLSVNVIWLALSMFKTVDVSINCADSTINGQYGGFVIVTIGGCIDWTGFWRIIIFESWSEPYAFDPIISNILFPCWSITEASKWFVAML